MRRYLIPLLLARVRGPGEPEASCRIFPARLCLMMTTATTSLAAEASYIAVDMP
jgi:hypothetical protein